MPKLVPELSPFCSPSLIVNPSIETLISLSASLSSTKNTRLELLPLILRLFAPKPSILRLLSIANSPKLKPIVPPLRLELKVIVSPDLAKAIASRKDKSPSLKSPSFSSSKVETTSSSGTIIPPLILSKVCSSNAPMSVPLPTVRSNPSPLCSVAKLFGLLPASIAGEFISKAKVGVAPPLSCSSLNLASIGLSLVPTMSLSISIKPDLMPPGFSILPMRLLPPEVKSPFTSSWLLPAIILLVIVAGPFVCIPPPSRALLLLIVLLVTLRVPKLLMPPPLTSVELLAIVLLITFSVLPLLRIPAPEPPRNPNVLLLTKLSFRVNSPSLAIPPPPPT